MRVRQIAADAVASRLDVKPREVFRFGAIRKVYRMMEVNRKTVVVQA
jgi:hypothetical protein